MMKKYAMIMLAVLSLAQAKHCDFIGKEQGILIAKSAVLDSLCTDFGKSYKDSKASSGDKGNADKVAKVFQENASQCKDSACLSKNFAIALDGFGKSNSEKPSSNSRSLHDANWGMVIIFLSMLILSTLALFVRQLKFIPNTAIIAMSVLGFVGQFYELTGFIIPSLFLMLLNLKYVMGRCPHCKTLGSKRTGSEISDLNHDHDKDGNRITTYRERIFMHCNRCDSDWVRGGHSKQTKKGHWHP